MWKKHYQLTEYATKALGLTAPKSISAGGVSDGNLTAALGIPTIERFRAVGGGVHAIDGHVNIPFVPERTALLAQLVHGLLSNR